MARRSSPSQPLALAVLAALLPASAAVLTPRAHAGDPQAGDDAAPAVVGTYFLDRRASAEATLEAMPERLAPGFDRAKALASARDALALLHPVYEFRVDGTYAQHLVEFQPEAMNFAVRADGTPTARGTWTATSEVVTLAETHRAAGAVEAEHPRPVSSTLVRSGATLRGPKGLVLGVHLVFRRMRDERKSPVGAHVVDAYESVYQMLVHVGRGQANLGGRGEREVARAVASTWEETAREALEADLEQDGTIRLRWRDDAGSPRRRQGRWASVEEGYRVRVTWESEDGNPLPKPASEEWPYDPADGGALVRGIGTAARVLVLR